MQLDLLCTMAVIDPIAHTAEAAVSSPAQLRVETSANTAAAVAGVGTDVILYAALVGVGFAWTNNVHLAKLVRTTNLMRDARVAAAFVICCTSACSSLALSLTLHSAGIGDGEKQDSEE